MILEDTYINILIEHNINQQQLLALYLLYKKRSDLIIRYKKHFNIKESIITQEEINDLIDKKLLIKKGNTYNVTDYFYSMFINSSLATDEIYFSYPTFLEKDGIKIPLTSYDRNAFELLYDNAIKSNMLEHLEVLKDIDFGKEKNLIHIGIEKFIKSKYWLILRKLRLELDELVLTNIEENEY